MRERSGRGLLGERNFFSKIWCDTKFFRLESLCRLGICTGEMSQHISGKREQSFESILIFMRRKYGKCLFARRKERRKVMKIQFGESAQERAVRAFFLLSQMKKAEIELPLEPHQIMMGLSLCSLLSNENRWRVERATRERHRAHSEWSLSSQQQFSTHFFIVIVNVFHPFSLLLRRRRRVIHDISTRFPYM